MKKSLKNKVYDFEYHSKNPFYLNEEYVEENHIPIEVFEAIDIFEDVAISLFNNINSGKMIKDVIFQEVPEEKLNWALMVYENWMESQDLPVEEE